VEGDKISWCFGGEIDQDSRDAVDPKTNDQWAPGNTQQLLEEIRDIPTVYGCKVGDIINTTPKGNVSSVLLEEKFFETWHSKRIVLLGDGTVMDMKMILYQHLFTMNNEHELTFLSPHFFCTWDSSMS